MSSFNTSKNVFNSIMRGLTIEFHAFSSLGVPKGTKSATQQKKSLINNVTDAINSIDTDDFGIRVFVLKTKQ